jgi:hypothetical protein
MSTFEPLLLDLTGDVVSATLHESSNSSEICSDFVVFFEDLEKIVVVFDPIHDGIDLLLESENLNLLPVCLQYVFRSFHNYFFFPPLFFALLGNLPLVLK